MIFKQLLLSGEKGWGLSSYNKLEMPKQFYSLPAFQYRRNSFNKRSSPREKLFDEIVDKSVFKRCLFR